MVHTMLFMQAWASSKVRMGLSKRAQSGESLDSEEADGLMGSPAPGVLGSMQVCPPTACMPPLTPCGTVDSPKPVCSLQQPQHLKEASRCQ